MQKAFSLVEVILVIAILAILASASVSLFIGYKRNLEVETGAQEIALKLKEVRGYTTYGDQFKKWGIHFANPTSGPDTGNPFFETYYCNNVTCAYSADITIKEKIYLSSFLQFNIPASGATCEVVFQINTGRLDATLTTCGSNSVVIAEKGTSNTKTVTINSEGKIE